MTALLTADDVRDWPRSPRGKLICPTCGQSGWSYFDARSWIQKHRWHEPCHICGKQVTVAGLAVHTASHRRQR